MAMHYFYAKSRIRFEDGDENAGDKFFSQGVEIEEEFKRLVDNFLLR